MRRVKSILGILLIILSLAGLFLWEWKGRDMVLLQEVLVAKNDIQKGTLVEESLFEPKGVVKDSEIEGALKPGDAAILKGKVTTQLIPGNSQIHPGYFRENEFYLKEGEAVFVLEPNWIAMRSSSLRRGDTADIYGNQGWELLGSYRVAFVKDEAEREVRDVSMEGKNYIEKDILERTDSTAMIDHIEIITTIDEYEKLVSYLSSGIPYLEDVEAEADAINERGTSAGRGSVSDSPTTAASSSVPPAFILVQGGEKIDP